MNFLLISTAAGLGIFHTAVGVDHYIPFVAMSKSNKWSFPKTMFIVLICGIGHVLASVILGIIGIWIGAQISSLTHIENIRGEIATWFLIAFGTVYMLWGIRNAVKNKPHRHIHSDGSEVWHHHKKEKRHDKSEEENSDSHTKKNKNMNSFWLLFILLVLGPCESLIPLMFSAAESGIMAVVIIALVFSVCTILTMLICTAVLLKGVQMIPIKHFERYAHALAGFAILACGLAILFLDI